MFITSRIIWFFVCLIVLFLSLYVALHYTSLQFFSSDGSTNTSFFGGYDKNNKITVQPEVMIPTLQVGRGRYDNQRILRIYDFYFTGRKWEALLEKYDICFATHTSIEKLYSVAYILERWTGPLSIALQLTSEEEWLIFNLFMIYLTKCHSAFENQASIHLAVPANLSALKIDDKILSQWEGVSLEAIWGKGQACPDAKLYLTYLMNMLPTTDLRKLSYKEYYPFNHMTNIGRKGCGTHWTYSADVDIIPSNGMADKIQQFYNDQKLQGKLCAKCAYVVPSFELNYTFPFPENKKKVVEYYKAGAAHQYHNNFKPLQAATEYKWWASHKLDEEAVTVSHPINQTKLRNYEPFYISPDDIVPVDERFVGYGPTRLSQFLAAMAAGWNFSVITPVFSIHWGFANRETYDLPKKGGFGKVVRTEQFNEKIVFYEHFLKELECKKEIGTI